jgi:hypothetical protein
VRKLSNINNFSPLPMAPFPALLALASFITSGLSAVYQQVGDVKKDLFDFVIAGGWYEIRSTLRYLMSLLA